MSDGMKWIVVIAGVALIFGILFSGVEADGGGFNLKIDPAQSIENREAGMTLREQARQQGETERTEIREENQTERARLGQDSIRLVLTAIVIIAVIWFVYDLRRRRQAAQAELAALRIRLEAEQAKARAPAPVPTWRPMPMPTPAPLPRPQPQRIEVEIDVRHSWRPGQSVARAPADIQNLWDKAAARHGDGKIDIVDGHWHYVNERERILVPLAPAGYLPAPKD